MSVSWKDLQAWTEARIGLPRQGNAVATKALLEFQWAHARARDAVHRSWNATALVQALTILGETTLIAPSQANSREIYLQRPDLGRQLAAQAITDLSQFAGEAPLAFCVSDGLSATAIDQHFLPFWKILREKLRASRYSYAPLVLVPFGRVAVSDTIGEKLGAKVVVIFVGERPGLTAADSMGAYLTYDPKTGNPDARRNCISNIRPPAGLSYELAAGKLCYLLAESLRRQISGVALKEDAANRLSHG